MENLNKHLLPESQCGFRKNWGTVDMTFTVRHLQDKYSEQHQDLFMSFVDLSKAFNTVNRELLWDILTKFGCPKKCCNILSQFHEGIVAHVTIGGQESEPFRVCVVVRQGCVLAPVLFSTYYVSQSFCMINLKAVMGSQLTSGWMETSLIFKGSRPPPRSQQCGSLSCSMLMTACLWHTTPEDL